MNNRVSRFQNEICSRLNIGSGFVGQYNSAWNDDHGQFTAMLQITQTRDNQFQLTWDHLQNTNGERINTTYEGIGTIISDQLICSYVMNN